MENDVIANEVNTHPVVLLEHVIAEETNGIVTLKVAFLVLDDDVRITYVVFVQLYVADLNHLHIYIATHALTAEEGCMVNMWIQLFEFNPLCIGNVKVIIAA